MFIPNIYKRKIFQLKNKKKKRYWPLKKFFAKYITSITNKINFICNYYFPLQLSSGYN